MKNSHPAPFPVALIERIIASTTAKLVLDPFMGSGTTAVAAKRLGRDYLGIEISPEYCALAEQRITLDSSGASSFQAVRRTPRKSKTPTQQMAIFGENSKVCTK